MSRPGKWVPHQHGAWAMLLLPYLLGATLAVRDGVAGWWLLPLLAFWLLGYFAFHAASQWLKAPARRRAGLTLPVLTWAAASAVAGVLTLVLGGTALAWWVPAYLPLLVPALWLASLRRERATVGGGLTVAAASLMALVARFPDPRPLLAAPEAAATPLAVALLVFWYFFGTVLYVKTNIRARGSRPHLVASVAWHAAGTVVAAVLAASGVVAWWWTVVFAVTTARAAWVPPRRWTPKQVGIGEAVVCVAIVVLFWLS